MGVWLTGIVILLIVGILLDGWRRMRQGRQNNLNMPSYQPQLEDDYSSELPNGGARVVAHRRTEPKIGAESDWDSAYSDGDDAYSDGAHSGWDGADSDLDGADSDLDGADDGWQREEAPAAGPEAQPAQEPYPPPEDQPHPTDESTREPATERPVDQPDAEPPARDEPAAEARIPQQVALNLDESVPMLMESVEQQEESEPLRPTAKAAPVPESAAQTRAPAPPARPAAKSSGHERNAPEEATEPEEVLIINVMAPAGTYFQGEALRKTIFDQGLRYGSMNIFHRYRDARGGGPVQFSLANMVKPGTFDLDAMDSFQTPGVSLFMTLPLEGDNVAAFDLMLATAKTLAETLGGELKDENRSAMTRQTMEHDRQRVLDFVRRQLSRVPG